MKKAGSYLLGNTTYSGELTSLYEGSHESLGNRVNVTLLNEDAARNQTIKNRFLELCQKWATLKNDCLPTWVDLFENKEVVGFVTETQEGTSLMEFINTRGKLDNKQINGIVLKILSTLSAIHERGLFHGNLNSHNIMVSDDLQLKFNQVIQDIVIDPVGQSSKIFAAQPVSNAIAPEAITQTSAISIRSDIYSCGVILWELVSGKKAFDVPFYEIPTRIVNENLPLTNSPWDEIIQKATTKSPNERYESCKSFIHAIELMDLSVKTPKPEAAPIYAAVPTATPPSTNPLSPFDRKPKAERNNKIKKIVVGSVLVLLTIAASLTYWTDLSNWIGSLVSFGSGSNQANKYDNLVDLDGNAYGVVRIGNLFWTTSNLKTTKYANGDPIAYIERDRNWIYTKKGAFCYYNNNPDNIPELGYLYNWHAVNDYRGLCPEGWRVPTANDYRLLDNYLEANGMNTGAVKSIDQWSAPNIDASNYNGLNILPGGKRMFSSGGYKFKNDGAYFWTSNEHSSRKAVYVAYAYDRSTSNQNDYYKNDGFSCRCVKDVASVDREESTRSEPTYLNDAPPRNGTSSIVQASSNSTMTGMSGFTYEPYKAIDKDIKTWWSPKDAFGAENWIQIDFDSPATISGIQIHGGSHYPNFRNYGDLYPLNLRVRKAEIVFDDGSKEIITLEDIDAIQTVMFRSPRTTGYFRIYPFDFYRSNKWNDICISEIIPIYN